LQALLAVNNKPRYCEARVPGVTSASPGLPIPGK